MKNIVLWVIGVATTLMSILFMILHFWSGLLILLSGLLLLPPISKTVNWTQRTKMWAFLGLFISGFVLAAVNTPELTPEQKAKIEAQKQTEIEKEKVEKTKAIVEAKSRETEAKALGIQANSLEGEQVGREQLVQVDRLSALHDVTCRIVGISDGDTATCLTKDKKQIKIRMDQIDAPEIGQDFGAVSKKVLSDLIYNQEVGLDTKEQDKYGRTVAEVFVDNNNINKQMVALGMAWAYREYMRDGEYEVLEDRARNAGVGLWSQPNPIYPSDYRRSKRGEQTKPLQTQQIQAATEKKALDMSGGQCGSKRYCKQMATCSEAKHYLNVCGIDRLDRDGDGVPCESLCR